MSDNANHTPVGVPCATSDSENAKASLIALASVPNGALPEGDDMHDAGTGDLNAKSTSFSAGVVEELERTNPGVLDWLRSSAGVMFQAALLFSYLVVEVLNALATSYVLKPVEVEGEPKPLKVLPSSMIVMNTGCSIILGFLITAASTAKSEGRIFGTVPKALRSAFSPRAVLKFAPVAAMFSISSVFSMLAYSKLDAGMKKILDQSRLPVTAAMSACITGKKYTMMEWLALTIIILSICCFYMADVQHDEVTELHTKCRYPPQCFGEPPLNEQAKICAMRVDGPTINGTLVTEGTNVTGTHYDIHTFEVKKAADTDLAGLLFSFLSTLFNCAGSLMCEKVFKGSQDTPFPAQKVQMETTGFPVAIAMSFLVPLVIDSKGGSAIWWSKNDAPGSGLGFFQGYTWTTGIAIGIDMLVAWMGGIIVKQFSSVVKIIAKCFVLLLVVFSTGVIMKPCHADSLPSTMWTLAFILTAATLLFAWMPKPPKAPAPAPVALAADGRTPLVEGQLQMANQVAAV